MSTQLFQSLAISLLLGGLVGLQRQHVDSPLGGVRTFPLVTIFGSLFAILAGPVWGLADRRRLAGDVAWLLGLSSLLGAAVLLWWR